MANVLTDLAADIYKAADVVGRELVGFIPASTINADGSEEAALNDTVRSHFTRAASAATISPAMTIPEGTDQTVDNKTLTLDNSKAVQIPWTGEDVKHVNNGSGFETIYGDQIAQAMRALANEVEADLATEAYRNASRAVGTAGTTPFASNFNTVADVRKILADNGCPVNDRQISLVMDTSAGVNLRNLAQLQKANEAGNDNLLRQGVLLDLQGLAMRESAQVQSHTKGTGSGYLLNDASSAIGDTTIAADTGTGTVLAGDVVTFAGTSHKYVVNSALSGGSFTIGAPGLRDAESDNDAITVGANFTGNVAFHRSALELAMRAPANPIGGDAASDMMLIQDPHSGLIFEVSVYKGYKKAMISVGAVWGVKAWKQEHIALLLG
jgi:hypothetical protein